MADEKVRGGYTYKEDSLDKVRKQARNAALQETADWLRDCLTHVNSDTETFKAITAVAKGIEGRKTPEFDEPPHEGQHYPLTR